MLNRHSLQNRANRRAIRHGRLRARLRGTAERPRLAVFRSARHLRAQLIDDDASRTVLGLADSHVTRDQVRAALNDAKLSAGVAQAFALGKLLAERAQAQGVRAAVFDRAGFAYHGQVRAVAEGARAGGLKL